jgi:hypothetical protein
MKTLRLLAASLLFASITLPHQAEAKCGDVALSARTPGELARMRKAVPTSAIIYKRSTRERVKDYHKRTRRQYKRPIQRVSVSMNTYRNRQYNLTIEYPIGWTVEEGFFGTLVSFISPLRDARDQLTENVNVLIQDQGGEMVDLALATNIALEELQKLPNFILVTSEPTTVGGRRAHAVVYTSESDGSTSLKFKQVWTMQNDGLYVFSFAAEPSQYDEYVQIFERMLDTVSLGAR